MNKRIDFSFNGGFPATQYMTDYMQTSYRAAFMAMAGLIGDKVIVMGCQRVGDQVTNGWLSVNGELVPFVGGAWEDGAQVVIVETSETRLFQDNNSHAVYFTRVARIGTPGLFAFSDLTNIGTLKTFIPAGVIVMWSGSVVNIPGGWALCNGQNGTPDLRQKFIAGYDPDTDDYNAIGKTGGEEKHTLTIAEAPAQQGTIKTYNELVQAPGSSGSHLAWWGTKDQAINIGGGGQAHENRPPYYVLAYIIKL